MTNEEEWVASWSDRTHIDGKEYYKLKTGDKLQVGDVYPCHDQGDPADEHDWELSDQTSMSNDWIRSGNVYYRPVPFDPRELIKSTSRLWDLLHIETVAEIEKPFHCIGDVEITNIGPHSHPEQWQAAQYKSAARKVENWLVNGDNGLESALSPAGIYRAEFEILEDDITKFANGMAHRATAFMMTRKHLRALIAATPSLIMRTYEGDVHRVTLFDRIVIVNDWINTKSQDIWGLNLAPGGLHLLQTEGGMRREPRTTRVLWNVGIGYKLGDDVTCMRKRFG